MKKIIAVLCILGICVIMSQLTKNEEKVVMMIDDFKEFSNVEIRGVDIEKLNESQREVLYLYASYWQALVDADIEDLNEMIEDDSTFTHMSGKKQTKQEYLADIEDGSLDYSKVVIENPNIQIDGDTASLECATVLTANAYGAKGEWPFSGTRTFVKQNESWKVVNK